jgi:NADP-dependent 3-hydroxy acid dehydrogenase YdfG
MRKLNDKVAWITGAGTGIGAAAARALVHEGMQVVLSGRRREPLDELAAELGIAALSRPLDVSDKDAVLALANEIIGRFGRIDVLVNSAD